MAQTTALTVIRSQYFLYFAVMGAVLPYFNLYCYHIGFSGYQIGMLSAVRSFAIVLFPTLWGVLADRFELRKPIYVTCNFLSAIIWLGYFFTTDFLPMVVITLIYGIFYTPIISLLETTTMDTLGDDKPRYGQTRVWGSISFILVVLVLGRLIESVEIGIILGVVLIGSIIQALLATALPSKKGRTPTISFSGIRTLLTLRFVLFLICAFGMLVSHSAYYGFFSIHMENLGLSGTYIGIAWAMASIAEIIVMVTSARLFRHYTPEKMMLFAYSMATIRWLILSWTTSAIIILFAQGLHAITYGVFHIASILYVDKLSPSQNKALGQAVNNSVTYGLGLMVGFYLSGRLYAQVSPFILFLVSAGIAAGCGIVFYAGVCRSRSDGRDPLG